MTFPSYRACLDFLGYDNPPKAVENIYAQMVKQNPKHPCINERQLNDVFKHLTLDDTIKTAIKEAYDIIISDVQLNFLIHFLIDALMVSAHPSHWYVKSPSIKHPKINTKAFECMVLIAAIPLSLDEHQQKGIDPKHAAFNLNHLSNAITSYYKKTQSIGVDNFGWSTYLATLGLIQLESLNFMHHIYQDRFLIFRNQEQKIIVLADDHLDVRKDGQINGVNDCHDLWFQTTFNETSEAYLGYYVHPDGYITNQFIQLNKKDWHLCIKKGDPVIDFHIPTKMGYTNEDIKKSFIAAKHFFQKYYANNNYQSFWCVSWLYSPQLHHFIHKPSSNIIHVAKQGYICPATPGEKSLYTFVFQNEQPDFNTLKPKTSLEEGVINYVLSGGKINTGMYLYMLKNVDQFGNQPYHQHTHVDALLIT